MKSSSWGIFVVLSVGAATGAFAQSSEHLIPASELQSILNTRTAVREATLADIRAPLRSDAVREKLQGAVDLTEVESLAARLDDETLADLGSQSRRVSRDVVATGSGTWAVVGAAAVAVAIILILTSVGG